MLFILCSINFTFILIVVNFTVTMWHVKKAAKLEIYDQIKYKVDMSESAILIL